MESIRKCSSRPLKIRYGSLRGVTEGVINKGEELDSPSDFREDVEGSQKIRFCTTGKGS